MYVWLGDRYRCLRILLSRLVSFGRINVCMSILWYYNWYLVLFHRFYLSKITLLPVCIYEINELLDVLPIWEDNSSIDTTKENCILEQLFAHSEEQKETSQHLLSMLIQGVRLMLFGISNDFIYMTSMNLFFRILGSLRSYYFFYYYVSSWVRSWYWTASYVEDNYPAYHSWNCCSSDSGLFAL